MLQTIIHDPDEADCAALPGKVGERSLNNTKKR